ncbi:MAG TPA: aldo/keto reductase [Chloroflexota bacterium]|nr:aldo/keto reductase [Chloroflexota bacterium]
MDPLARRQLGQTNVQVTCLGFGGATLGDIRERIDESRSATTIEVAYGAGIGFFDTAPWYGTGKSERRYGNVLGLKPRDSYVLSTKIGRILDRPADPATFQQTRWTHGLPFVVRFDYTYDGVMRSYEDSLTRMGINRIDALLIHDLDHGYHGTEAGVQARIDELDAGGGYRALRELKERGEIGAIGAGINVTGMIPRFLERFDLDFFLVAMPYTLLSQDALDVELPLVQSRGATIVIGAVFASGILAIGPVPGATYGYQPATPEILEKARRIQEACQQHDVPLGAAALQFPFGHPAVSSVIPGPNAPEQVKGNLAWMRVEIPADLWGDLKEHGLLRPDAPTP